MKKPVKWSRSIVRFGLSAGLVLTAWLLATCGAPSRSPSSASAGAGLIDYRRTGGIAGFDDHLAIQEDGTATLQQKGGSQQTFTLEPGTLSDLKDLLSQTDFAALEGQHAPDRPIPDAFHYTITYQDAEHRYTVEATDGAVPEQLTPVLDELNQIIADNAGSR